MFDKARAFLLSLTITAVLVFSAVGTTVVYADDKGPPEPPPAETTSDECRSGAASCTIQDPEAGEKPAVVTDDSAAEEATPVSTVELAPQVEDAKQPQEEDTSSSQETAPATAQSGSLGDKPLLDSVPENTTVAVLNAAGEVQPLATQAAADALSTSDPIWCPAAQTVPTPGANGCTQSFSSFTALLTFLSGNASFTGAGTIFVEQGNYQGGESTINFNNFNLSNISGSNLTINGGWDTPTATSTFNNVSILIGSSTNPWGGSLTLNNIIINNPTNTGISLNSNSDINLTNVNVTNSTNGAGAELTSGGNVTIVRSRFERNKTAGAIIRAIGNVAIETSSFSNPANARRQIVGLDIVSDGDVSLFQVLANENREAGATIDAAGRVTIVESQFSGTKAIVGGQFLGYGLTVVSQDAIDLDTVTANDNFLWGASLTAVGDVTIANSTFNANTTESPGFIDDTGLLVTSGGNVSIFNSHADDNRLIGATITAAGDVAITDSTFNSNNGVTLDSAGNPTFHGYGLQVIAGNPTSVGSISLLRVTASNNTLFGAHLEANGDVTVSDSDFSNQTSGDATALTGRGLEIVAAGNVFLDTVTLNNNQTFGADIQTTGTGSAVFLNGVTADGNGANGVQVETACGALFLIGGTYQNNGQYGLSVLNSNIIQTVAPVFANNVAGNIFQDPGTCVFTPTTPPTPPTTPPVYSPNDLGAVAPQTSANGFARSLGFSSKSWSFGTSTMTLNSFLASFEGAYSGLHLGPFTGKYAYVYLSSGMQIVMYTPNSLNEFAMNGS